MKKQIKRKVNNQSGAAMLISVIFFLFISLTIIAGLVSPSVREFKIANDLIKSRQSLFLSESGIEDAYFRMKTAKSITSVTILTLGENSSTTTITNSGYNEKTISTMGDVSSRQRKNELVLNAGTGASFSYGIQTGVGGFVLGNSTIEGSVYSNGTIISTNPNATITGSAFAVDGLINSLNIGTAGEGDAWAYEVKKSTVAGNLYCKTGSQNNKPCDTSRAGNPPPTDMPISQEMIDLWKSHAEDDVHTGDMTISTNTSMGGKKITGNLAINANLTITDTIYVVGTISIASGMIVELHPSYGSTLGVMITDSPINLINNINFKGSGSEGSFLMLLTTSDCPSVSCPSTNALNIWNNVEAVILNAQNGTAEVKNNLRLNALVANKIIIGNNATITYLSGLADTYFTSGPSGGWEIQSWKEVK